MCTSNFVLFCALYLALFGHYRAPLILHCHCCALLLELLWTSNLDLSRLFTCSATAVCFLPNPATILYLQPCFYTAIELLVLSLPCHAVTLLYTSTYPCLVPVFNFIIVLTLRYTSNLFLALSCTSAAPARQKLSNYCLVPLTFPCLYHAPHERCYAPCTLYSPCLFTVLYPYWHCHAHRTLLCTQPALNLLCTSTLALSL